LLIDEVLGVGDQEFHAKCVEKIHAFQLRGTTCVLASHDSDLITRLCQKVLWIEKGHVVMLGEASEVIAAYRAKSS
jgi:ABC-type polysaccharide/polyol phosphate transport system ATPase subunit